MGSNARPELLPEAGAQRTLKAVSSRPLLGAAQNRRWLSLKHWINCDNGQPVFEGLTHQHTVKRVPVDSRQGRELTDTGLIQGEAR